ncbi:MAG TPA: protein rep [Ktedonobacteraceae bacterium]|nr:protein rep [Ktedonobacteraceae bacterium]
MANTPLGTIARNLSTNSAGGFTRQSFTEEEQAQARRKRMLRWALQAEARALLPNERVAECLRAINPMSIGVQVLYSSEHQVAHYKSLIVCGSVWMCPLCAAKISERRREELEQAIARHREQNGGVYMATYTVSHSRHDDLSDLLRAFQKARERMKQGMYAQRRKQAFGIVGTISVLEVTWSSLNHWHPHSHELLFTLAYVSEEESRAYECASRLAWRQAAAHFGLHMDDEHGYRLDRTFGAVADYIAKFGREPVRKPWGVESEMTKGHIKTGRGTVIEHYTPFALLDQIMQGQTALIPVFEEYAGCFKGRHQLHWSKGLRKRLLDSDEELTDEELAAADQDEAVLLGLLTRAQWRVVLANDMRGELLEAAQSGDWQQVEAFLLGIGCDLS